MICPKCNHSQEDIIECESCGIIFDRYFNLIVKKKLDEAVQLYNEGKYQVALAAFKAIINVKIYKDKQIDEKCQEYIVKTQELLRKNQNTDDAVSIAETKSDSVAESGVDIKGDNDSNKTECCETEAVIDCQVNIEKEHGLTGKEQTKICPYCKEAILLEAIRCKWCKSDILIPEGRVNVDLLGIYRKYNKDICIAILFVAISSVFFIKVLSNKETKPALSTVTNNKETKPALSMEATVRGMLDNAKKGENTGEYWVADSEEIKLFNVYEYEILSFMPIGKSLNRCLLPTARELNRIQNAFLNNGKKYNTDALTKDIAKDLIASRIQHLATIEDLAQKRTGYVYKVRINSTNKAGIPIVNIWSISVVFSDSKWKVSYIYDEDKLCEMKTNQELINDYLNDINIDDDINKALSAII